MGNLRGRDESVFSKTLSAFKQTIPHKSSIITQDFIYWMGT